MKISDDITNLVYSTSEFLGSLIPFLKDWQELAGAIIGVFGALFVAIVGFIINHYYQRYQELRENLRRTEIALALGLNDLYDIERHLNDFKERVNKNIIVPLEKGVSATNYFLNKTNFPPLAIHISLELLVARYTSYYVHNKILTVYKNTEQLNSMFVQMKTEYESIRTSAEFLIAQKATPKNQQDEYLINHKSFLTFVDDIIEQLQLAKKAFAQTKLYNLKLLTKQRFSIWKAEGVSFKFFTSKKSIEKYRSTLICLDRIDEILAAEVEKALEEAESSLVTNENGLPVHKANTYKKLRDYLYEKLTIIVSKFTRSKF